jgi:flagellar protein FliJ
MRSQSQFCVRSVLNESPTLAPAPGGPNKSLVNRLKQPGIENNRQRVAQIEAIIADFDKTANELDGWIQAEQERTRIHDPAHFAYSTSATAMIQRRDKLKRSIDELKRQLADADVSLG